LLVVDLLREPWPDAYSFWAAVAAAVFYAEDFAGKLSPPLI
jgi:hypothetical protein